MKSDALNENRRLFEAGIRRLGEIADAETCLDLAYWLMFFAQDGGCGYFASSAIESRLCEFSKRLLPPRETEVCPGTVLMVMTTAYVIGGHTRVVERWIEQDPSRRYSLVLTDQRNAAEIPERLKAAVARSGGELLVLDVRASRMERAQRLRDFAASFERVVLHIHMYDVISFVAFGSDAFTRPVGFFNHADHVPWLGVSIADCVAEFREWGAVLSRECRGVRKSVMLGIPSDGKMDERGKSDKTGASLDVRERYGIRPDVPLVLTCGRPVKYQPVAGMDFLDAVRGILSSDADAVVLAIGPTLEELPGWCAASRAFGGRLKAVGPMPFGLMPAFYKTADLVLDSYPMGGSTALADALVAGCPALSVPNPFGKDDWVCKTKGHCASIQSLVEKAGVLLKDRSLANECAMHDLNVYREARAPQQFKERMEAFFAQLDAPHEIRPFAESVGLRPEVDRALWEMSQSTEEVFRGIPKVFSCVRHRTPLSSTRVLTLFGHDFVFHKRLKLVGKMLRDLGVSCVGAAKGE